MTMDIANQVKSTVMSEEHVTKAPSKRSFDVAFLMLPDEKLKQKQDKQAKLDEYPTHQISVKNDLLLRHPPPEAFDQRREETEEIDIVSNGVNNNNHSPPDHMRHFRYHSLPMGRLPRIYDDPTILPTPEDAHRSAFTKVPHLRDSPNPPLSPDQLSCPSISPPVSVSPPRPYPPAAFRPTDYAFTSPTHMSSPASPTKIKQQFMYRPGQELPPQYLPSASFPFNAAPHPFIQQQSEIAGIVRNPAAAAILSTLIPPTLASTFSLTAQNVCAKCNISFRMTSDLVYHMRSHHKNDMTGDPMRRKREEKLKCPVCNESFRERHHLTRHMTAHQDKESDDAEAPNAVQATPGSSFELHQVTAHQARRQHHKTH
ncbi:PR domain zinc finger protein 8 [Phlebotomus argentipes]|uniref:PR domain zinc finger protein 8 n=1 Tax=Phlebotomus argentipes TaxID=94469 RepID=UPI002892D74E|nr:PR domain zinc finger protein 8 [Phlebotomus argentipes]